MIIRDAKNHWNSQAFEIGGVPKGARISPENQCTRNEVGHFFFRRFLHVSGTSVPPTWTNDNGFSAIHGAHSPWILRSTEWRLGRQKEPFQLRS
jgi:hypothetical protein